MVSSYGVNKIVYKGDFFTWAATDRPIPPDFEVEEAELVVRLQSTARGRAARWAAGKEVVGLNDAPYNPMLRARVQRFRWWPPGAQPDWLEALIDSGDLYPNQVVQLGAEVPNWTAHVVTAIPDPFREFITRNIGKIREGLCFPDLQGHLRVGRVVMDEQLPWFGGRRRIFNHYLVGRKARWEYRVVDGEAIGLAVGPGWILSPDHPNEPIELLTSDRAVYVFSHPIPSPTRGGTVD